MEKKVKELLERLAEWEKENEAADLTQMEEAIEGELAVMKRQLLEKMANKELKEKQACPKCGQEMMKNGKKKRKLRTKNGEEVTIEREQRRCHQCGMTIFPPR